MVTPVVESRLGTMLRARRHELNLTQTEVADRAGISQTYLSNLERGRVHLPDVSVRRRLAEALRISHVDLLIAAGELDVHELPGSAEAIRPVVVGLAARLDVLPQDVRRAVERIIDDLHRSHQAGMTPATELERSRSTSSTDVP